MAKEQAPKERTGALERVARLSEKVSVTGAFVTAAVGALGLAGLFALNYFEGKVVGDWLQKRRERKGRE